MVQKYSTFESHYFVCSDFKWSVVLLSKYENFIHLKLFIDHRIALLYWNNLRKTFIPIRLNYESRILSTLSV